MRLQARREAGKETMMMTPEQIATRTTETQRQMWTLTAQQITVHAVYPQDGFLLVTVPGDEQPGTVILRPDEWAGPHADALGLERGATLGWAGSTGKGIRYRIPQVVYDHLSGLL
jgi:hypothetical protein